MLKIRSFVHSIVLTIEFQPRVCQGQINSNRRSWLWTFSWIWERPQCLCQHHKQLGVHKTMCSEQMSIELALITPGAFNDS